MVIYVAAVSFAVLVMFMQLGFLNGLYDSQTCLVRSLRADLLMLSRARHSLATHESFSRNRLVQAAGCVGVEGVYPLYLENSTGTYVRDPRSGDENALLVIGFRPEDPVFAIEDIERQLPALSNLGTALFDTRSRSLFGPLRRGTVTELNSQKVRVVGTFAMGANYLHDGTLVMRDESLFRLFPSQRAERVALGLIQLEHGADVDGVMRELRRRLPGDVDVMTRDQVIEREKEFWRKATPAGYVFGLGVVVGFVIGVIICYQILYTNIVDHLRQLATLKAMGYRDRDVVGIVIRQSLLLSLLGFGPGVVMSACVYAILTSLTAIGMYLIVGRVAFILSLTVAMCVASAGLAVRKALAADPAELF